MRFEYVSPGGVDIMMDDFFLEGAKDTLCKV